MTSPLKVCGLLGEVDSSGNLQKDAATRKAHSRRARARNRMTLAGDDTDWVLCRRKEENRFHCETFSQHTDIINQAKTNLHR